MQEPVGHCTCAALPLSEIHVRREPEKSAEKSVLTALSLKVWRSFIEETEEIVSTLHSIGVGMA